MRKLPSAEQVKNYLRNYYGIREPNKAEEESIKKFLSSKVWETEKEKEPKPKRKPGYAWRKDGEDNQGL